MGAYNKRWCDKCKRKTLRRKFAGEPDYMCEECYEFLSLKISASDGSTPPKP